MKFNKEKVKENLLEELEYLQNANDSKVIYLSKDVKEDNYIKNKINYLRLELGYLDLMKL